MSERPPWARDHVRVESARDLAERLARGPGERACFVPTGGGTCLGRGARPREETTLLEMSALDRVIEHAASDLTVTVEAGHRVAELQKILEPHGQWLAADPAPPPGSTIGGLLASDRRGLLAGGLGTVRDHLLGVAWLDGSGREIAAGGRVVKNVAGYDLMKLMTGSLGELGILVRATFRLLPRPRAWRAVVRRHPPRELSARVLQEARSWYPTALWRGTWDEEHLVALFQGSPARVNAQVDMAVRVLGGESSVLQDDAARALFEDLSRRLVPGDRPVAWGGALPAFLAAADLDALFGEAGWIVDLLSGHLWSFPAALSEERVDTARLRLREGEGHLHVDVPAHREPWARPWGSDPGDERALWSGLKDALDPDGRFASGRLPGGV